MNLVLLGHVWNIGIENEKSIPFPFINVLGLFFQNGNRNSLSKKPNLTLTRILILVIYIVLLFTSLPILFPFLFPTSFPILFPFLFPCIKRHSYSEFSWHILLWKNSKVKTDFRAEIGCLLKKALRIFLAKSFTKIGLIRFERIPCGMCWTGFEMIWSPTRSIELGSITEQSKTKK